MAQEEQQKKSVVKTTSIVAAGCASVVAAIFTSKLGVAGTLVGTAMTSMVITLTSAVLNAQFERASTKIPGLPGSIRGRRSMQHVRVPGNPNAERSESASEEPRSEPLDGNDGRQAGFLERLRSVPDLLRAMSPSTRRRVLVSGALAGIAATAIALAAITFTEAAAGEDLSTLVWSQYGTASGSGESVTSVGRFLGGAPGAGDQQYNAPSGGQQYSQEPGVQPGGDAQQPQEDPVPQPTPGEQQLEDPAQQPAPGGQQPVPPPDQYDQYSP